MRARLLIITLSLVLPTILSASAEVISSEEELAIERKVYEIYVNISNKSNMLFGKSVALLRTSIEEKTYEIHLKRAHKLFNKLFVILRTSDDEEFFRVVHQEGLKEQMRWFCRYAPVLLYCAYQKKGYNSIIRWLLSIKDMKNVSGKILKISAEANDLPAVLRCCWEEFIKQALYKPNNFKNRVLKEMPSRIAQNQPLSEFLNKRFINALDWDNYQEQARQLDANITLNTAIEFSDRQLLYSALRNRPDFSFEDEFGELPLTKAQRIGNPVIIKHLAYYAHHKDRFMTIIENNVSEAILLKKTCPALAFLRNSNGDTVLHLALLTGSTELVYEILSCYPAAIAIPNNDGNTPLHLLAKHNGISQSLLSFMQHGLQNIELEEKKKQEEAPSLIPSTMRALASLVILPFTLWFNNP